MMGLESSTGGGTSRPRRVAVLGSTGSIGRAALEVIARQPEHLAVGALSAGKAVDLLAAQALEFRPPVVAIADASLVEELRARLGPDYPGEIWSGPDAAERLARAAEIDVVLNGLVGAAGLLPSRAALLAKKPLALANKESLVIAGACLTRLARETGTPILPIDSEHSGVFQLLPDGSTRGLRRIVLTASGGPFRTRSLNDFDAIRPEEALKHPTWEMGPRITVDSATLLNKGFEVLEAKWLFDLDPSAIDVWIHPQSIVHAFVEWSDGSTTAQLAVPDMRIPIQVALLHPTRLDSGWPRCDLPSLPPLQFERPEPARYPCLALARRALDEGATAPSVLNAADEIAVHAFLSRQVRFPMIADLLARVLDERPRESGDEVEVVLEADAWARRRTAALVAEVA